jgi:hypothetical protein
MARQEGQREGSQADLATTQEMPSRLKTRFTQFQFPNQRLHVGWSGVVPLVCRPGCFAVQTIHSV